MSISISISTNIDNNSTNYVKWYLNSNSEPDIAFVKWISKIEKKIILDYNLTLLDLPDEDYMMYFEQKYSFKDVIKIIKESNRFV